MNYWASLNPDFKEQLLKQIYWWKWQTTQQLNYQSLDDELPIRLRRLSAYSLTLKKLAFLSKQVSGNEEIWKTLIKKYNLNEDSALNILLQALNTLINLVDGLHADLIKAILNQEKINQWHNELEYGLFQPTTCICIGYLTDPSWMLLDSQKISISNNKNYVDYNVYLNVNTGVEAVRWGEIQVVGSRHVYNNKKI